MFSVKTVYLAIEIHFQLPVAFRYQVDNKRILWSGNKILVNWFLYDVAIWNNSLG